MDWVLAGAYEGRNGSSSRSRMRSDGIRIKGLVGHGLDCQRVAVMAHCRTRFRTHSSVMLLRQAEWRSKQRSVGCVEAVASL